MIFFHFDLLFLCIQLFHDGIAHHIPIMRFIINYFQPIIDEFAMIGRKVEIKKKGKKYG